jgi:hypothetical protein
MEDFNLTLFETCEFLNRSKKSISRYIRKGLLHPRQVKSKQGTLEYRFSKEDIEAFRLRELEQTDQTGHLEDKTGHQEEENKIKTGREDRTEETKETEKTGQETGHNNEIIDLLKETTGLLKEQLIKKDEQIKDLGGKIDQLIERDRETNILLKGLQDKVLMLERPEDKTRDRTDRTEDGTGQDTEPDADKTAEKQREQLNKETDKTADLLQKQPNESQDKTSKKQVKGFWKLFK